MKSSIFSKILFGSLSFFALTPSASAVNYTTVYDSYNDASGGNEWELYSIAYGIESGNLYFQLMTGFDYNSQIGNDSYGSNVSLRGGDLYINVNGSHNAGTGSVFGLGLSNHSGDQTADPNDNGYAWSSVSQGNLYRNAVFSTGTYESYTGADQLFEDGGLDPFGHENNIPSLIAGYTANLGFQAPILFSLLNGGGSVQVNPDGTTRSNVYRIQGLISLAALGIINGGSFELWWSPECGNDTLSVNGAVPEPATLGLLTFGLMGLGGVTRRRKNAVK